jgi:hypothetical protein
VSADNPSTFLEIVQRTAMECGVSLTGPSSTANQTGRLGQIVGWAQTSWMDIQTKHNDWKFMRAPFTVATVASDGKYGYAECTDTAASAVISAFRCWCTDSLKIYLTSAGSATETPLYYIDRDDWYRRYNTGSQSNSCPSYFSVDNDDALLLAPKPDAIYTVSGEYMKAATAMSGDTDTPELPQEYRMAIVYRAMMKYGRYTSAPEVFNDGQSEYLRVMAEMRRTQRPREKTGGPLA